MADTVMPITHITKTSGFRRGEPYIAGRHISVEFVADLYVNHNLSAEEIAHNQALTPAQVHAALAYYYDHPEEIEAIWQEQDRIGAADAISPQETVAERARLEAQLQARNPELAAALTRLRAEDPAREMTVPEIAAEFHITEQAVRKAAKNQTLPAHKAGRDWLIKRADALAYWGKRDRRRSG